MYQRKLNETEEIILLQRLEQHLSYYMYDKLGLLTLTKMRNEVHGRIIRIIKG